MSWFFKTKPKTNKDLVLILDLGSASVGATLGTLNFKATPGTCLTPLATKRQNFSASAKSTPEQFKHEVGLALAEVIQSVAGNIKPAEIYCFLSSLYYVGAPRLIKLDEQKPFAFTNNLIKKIVDEEVEQVKEEFSRRGWSPWSMEVLEREVLQLVGNGYHLPAAKGELVNSANINLFVAGADQTLLETVRQVVRQHFTHLPLHFRSFTSASFVVMRDLLPATPSFVMVDISGEITDISIVNQGCLVGVGSFPMGYQALIKQLAESSRSNPVDIETKLTLLSKNNLPPTLASLVKSTDLLLDRWRQDLETACRSILGDLFLPEEIVLIGENELTSLFANVLKKTPLTNLTLGSNEPVIYEVGDKLLGQLCQGVAVPGDSFLLLETLFCHKIKALTQN